VTSLARRPAVRVLLWIAAPIVAIAILRPWTVRPLEGQKPVVFDPGGFVSSAWPRLVRDAILTATEVSDVVPAAGASPTRARFVKGRGVVTAVDRRSRVGVILVRVPGSSPVTVAIQIGPVVRGTALRDASGFIRFSDFTNQTEYAAAANALNESALRVAIAPLQVESLQGRTVAFVAAAGTAAPREDGAIEIVPVQLELIEDRVK
jgi:predicted lipoprotein